MGNLLRPLSPLPAAPIRLTFLLMPDTPDADPRFNEFILIQAQNAGLFLGQLPNPQSGEKNVNLRAAQSVIDSLEMLASKTQGNLTESESKLLDVALTNLKPIYDQAVEGAPDSEESETYEP